MTGNEKHESDSNTDAVDAAAIEAEAEAEEREQIGLGRQSGYDGFFPGENHLHELDGL